MKWKREVSNAENPASLTTGKKAKKTDLAEGKKTTKKQ